jgi:hypothetical protein
MHVNIITNKQENITAGLFKNFPPMPFGKCTDCGVYVTSTVNEVFKSRFRRK